MQASPVARSAGRSDGCGPANADGQVGQQTAREPPPPGAPKRFWRFMNRMGTKGANPPADVLAARVAAKQHGVTSVAQLLAAGLSRRAVQVRIQAGRLHRIHRGVYAVGHTSLTHQGRWMAAVLACGEGAVLSHRSAAMLWGLLNPKKAAVDVTVPGTG